VNTPLQIGITGGIGSGKSLICKIFSCLGVPVYDADSRAKYVMTTDGILISQIKKEFGDLSFDSNGNLNRKYLSESVFGNPEKLERLNKLVHPRVGADYKQWVQQNHSQKYVLKEAALLFESGSHQLLDKVIVVYAPQALRLKRVLNRDKQRTQKQVNEIMERQWPEEEKAKRADFIIQNDERQLVIPQVLELHRLFSKQQGE
jgi:dephospho-CoA kinase